MDHVRGDWLDATQMHSLLRQELIWIDKDLRTHRLEDMSTRYLGHVAHFMAVHYPRWRKYVNKSLRYVPENPPLGHEHASLEPLPMMVTDTVLFVGIMRELDGRSD